MNGRYGVPALEDLIPHHGERGAGARLQNQAHVISISGDAERGADEDQSEASVVKHGRI